MTHWASSVSSSAWYWTISSPPPYYNFHHPPTVTEGPYDGYEKLVYDPKIKGYVEKKASA